MRKLIIFSALSLLLTSALTSCGKSPVEKLYKESQKMATSPEVVEDVMPQLANTDDSISFLMGYIYGESFRNNLQKEGVTDEADLNEYEIGAAMALQADSSELQLLKGVMAGLTLRNAFNRLGRDVKVDWNSNVVFKGMYHGLNETPADKIQLPEDGAEGALNRLLYNYFKPEKIKSNQE
ncbi:MAG: hypothetical protein K2H32_09040 [Muribaculaceae bacterium]|nr:hypothetical protein [Muribaculaceae bacterium]MDE5858484.1 hypothetical protein [Muribaculaceae bacterium]